MLLEGFFLSFWLLVAEQSQFENCRSFWRWLKLEVWNSRHLNTIVCVKSICTSTSTQRARALWTLSWASVSSTEQSSWAGRPSERHVPTLRQTQLILMWIPHVHVTCKLVIQQMITRLFSIRSNLCWSSGGSYGMRVAMPVSVLRVRLRTLRRVGLWPVKWHNVEYCLLRMVSVSNFKAYEESNQQSCSKCDYKQCAWYWGHLKDICWFIFGAYNFMNPVSPGFIRLC